MENVQIFFMYAAGILVFAGAFTVIFIIIREIIDENWKTKL